MVQAKVLISYRRSKGIILSSFEVRIELKVKSFRAQFHHPNFLKRRILDFDFPFTLVGEKSFSFKKEGANMLRLKTRSKD